MELDKPLRLHYHKELHHLPAQHTGRAWSYLGKGNLSDDRKRSAGFRWPIIIRASCYEEPHTLTPRKRAWNSKARA
uniref:Uncharacterized protein n=1 Tax=Peronospora matthiolae TaxID=2874970 RepID=A0AAV1TJL3_9STRA